MSTRTHASQDDLMNELVNQSLAHPSTLAANYDANLSTYTLQPKLAKSLLETYESKALLKTTITKSGLSCDDIFIKALIENGFTYHILIDGVVEDSNFTVNGVKFMSGSHKGKHDDKLWCMKYTYVNDSISGGINPFHNKIWYKDDWINKECARKVGLDIMKQFGVHKYMRQTEYVKEKIDFGVSLVYRKCEKNIFSYWFDRVFEVAE
jgi:hypothetical protein